MWYKIAEVNGLTAESQLIEGMPLLIPVGVVRTSNTAETFKPYDPGGHTLTRTLAGAWRRLPVSVCPLDEPSTKKFPRSPCVPEQTWYK